MSLPALAIAAAAVTEVSRYTGVKPTFLRSLDIFVSHASKDDGRPVFTVEADAVLFGFVHTSGDGSPIGVHEMYRAAAA